MKISIEHYDKKITYEMSDETALPEMVETLDLLLRCLGYCYSGTLEIVGQDEDNC
jgi:hypothetical protein